MRTARSRRTKKHPKESTAEGMDEVRSSEPSTLSGDTFTATPGQPPRGSGPDYAGQSGDLQDLSRQQSADSESVEELVAEGQYREAEIIDAVEEADEENLDRD